MEGLHITGLDIDRIKAHPKVTAFYARYRQWGATF
jgi:hypothetical protein